MPIIIILLINSALLVLFYLYLKEKIYNKDINIIERNIETYYEFPPIFKHSKTKWNDNWNDEEYPTENPLLDNSQKLENQTAFDPSNFYTWPTYVKLL